MVRPQSARRGALGLTMAVELVVHLVESGRVRCGQVKMRTGERRSGLRFTGRTSEVTCAKCRAAMLRDSELI